MRIMRPCNVDMIFFYKNKRENAYLHSAKLFILSTHSSININNAEDMHVHVSKQMPTYGHQKYMCKWYSNRKIGWLPVTETKYFILLNSIGANVQKR